MKTAIGLLGLDWCNDKSELEASYCVHDLELVAKRAREEAFEMAAQTASDAYDEVMDDCNCGYMECGCHGKIIAAITVAIRALKGKP